MRSLARVLHPYIAMQMALLIAGSFAYSVLCGADETGPMSEILRHASETMGCEMRVGDQRLHCVRRMHRWVLVAASLRCQKQIHGRIHQRYCGVNRKSPLMPSAIHLKPL